jgi:hypothetical protein
MDPTYGEDLLRISFNGGTTYNTLTGANLTTYTVGVNFTSHLVGSMYGGTQIAGAVVVEAVGTNQDFSLGNTSLVLYGETGGVELSLPFDAPGGQPPDPYDGNGVDNMWSSSTAPQSTTLFNVTLPHSQGVFARDELGPPPTPSPTLVNATIPPTPVPVTCTDLASVESVGCPIDTVLNCTFCPTNRLREGGWYPCYRESAQSGVAGRCLPPQASAVQFEADETVALSVRTTLRAGGVPVSAGSTTALPDENGESVFATGHSLTTYDPVSLIEEMDPLGAASIRRSTDAATSITFSGAS